MSNAITTWLKAELAKIEGNSVVQAVETDAEAIGASALAYIKSNALASLYQIALSVLTGAATGTPWATIGATVVSQGEAAGITIAKGAESIVLAQAEADLIAQGKLIAPTSGAVVSAIPAVDPATLTNAQGAAIVKDAIAAAGIGS